VEVSARPPPPRYREQRWRGGSQERRLARARADLGYEPQYDLEAGLRDFVAELQRDAGR